MPLIITGPRLAGVLTVVAIAEVILFILGYFAGLKGC